MVWVGLYPFVGFCWLLLVFVDWLLLTGLYPLLTGFCWLHGRCVSGAAFRGEDTKWTCQAMYELGIATGMLLSAIANLSIEAGLGVRGSKVGGPGRGGGEGPGGWGAAAIGLAASREKYPNLLNRKW